ncbi:MAG: hypothetical protein H7296_00800 [Bacteroidia bacterium]|nr:hypothetical protein [Bacteroidia bacterium]
MKIKQLLFLFINLLLTCFICYSQNKPNTNLPVSPAKVPAPAAPAKAPAAVVKPLPVAPPLKASPQMSVVQPLKPVKEPLGPGIGMGLKFSTNGLGIEFSKSLTSQRKVVMRGFATYLPYQLSNFPFKFNRSVVLNINMNVKLGAIGLLFDVHPFNNSFKLTVGAAYMLLNAKSTAMLKDSIKQNDITLSPEEVGVINAEISGSPIAPYAGIGIGRAIPRKRIGFSVEIGTYYMGSPKVSFVCNGLLEPTSNQQKVLEENLKTNKWLPQIMFNLNFRLTK